MKIAVVILLLSALSIAQNRPELTLTPDEATQLRAIRDRVKMTAETKTVSEELRKTRGDIYYRRHLPESEYVICDGPVGSPNCKDVPKGAMALRRR